MRKIIIEGCDGTGKTTLCKKLAEHYGLDIVHVTSKDPNDFDFYRQLLRKTNVVFDRHFVGELIYPVIYNRVGKLSFTGASYLRNICIEEGVVVIVLTADIEEIRKRLQVRGEETFVFNALPRILDQFSYLAEHLQIRMFDTSKDSFESICHYIDVNCGSL